MCLAVPAKIIQIKMTDDDLLRTGVVDFSGVQKEISLAYVPEAVQGDYVIVHAGFAISLLDESEALESLQAFDDLAAFELTL
jgi:hydrogenase expression/formation protein HypC